MSISKTVARGSIIAIGFAAALAIHYSLGQPEGIDDNKLKAAMSAETLEKTVRLGTKKYLTPYFKECQKKNNVTPGTEITLEQAKKVSACTQDGYVQEEIGKRIAPVGKVIINEQGPDLKQ